MPRPCRRCSSACSSSAARCAAAMTSARWSASCMPPRRARRTSSAASSSGSGRSSASTTAPPRSASVIVCDSDGMARARGDRRRSLRRLGHPRASTPTGGCWAPARPARSSSARPTTGRASPTWARTTSAARSSATATSRSATSATSMQDGLPLPLRPRARHGHLRRRQHLSRRDRGVPARARRASATSPCSASPTTPSARRWPPTSTPSPPRGLTETAVREHVRSRLAGYKVPQVVVFDADLPREESGKIFKRRIRERYWLEAGRSI